MNFNCKPKMKIIIEVDESCDSCSMPTNAFYLHEKDCSKLNETCKDVWHANVKYFAQI